jgi:hypothetical protein
LSRIGLKALEQCIEDTKNRVETLSNDVTLAKRALKVKEDELDNMESRYHGLVTLMGEASTGRFVA